MLVIALSGTGLLRNVTRDSCKLSVVMSEEIFTSFIVREKNIQLILHLTVHQ